MDRVDESAVRARVDEALAAHRQDFETFFLARLLGLDLAYLPEGAPDAVIEACRIRFTAEPFLFNPQGSLHGGIIAAVMDISMGHLIAKVAGAGATVEMKLQFLRPLGAGPALCEGRFLRRGRTLGFLESRLWTDEAGAPGRLAAHATATWKMPDV
ncbi:MAG: PaaI family thioesterase [Pseudomonadota bacterium]